MTRPNFKLLTSLLGGVLLAATLATASASAQSSSSRSSPTPPPPTVTTGPTIVIVGEEAAPPPPTSSRSRRSRSSGRSDAALELVWGKLGAGNADTIDVNSNPRLRLLLPSLGIYVPRDGILRKPRNMIAASSTPSGSSQPPAVGPFIMTTDGGYLLPDETAVGDGPTIVYLSGDTSTSVTTGSTQSSSRSSRDSRDSRDSRYASYRPSDSSQTVASSAPPQDGAGPGGQAGG